jgi:hypothetical protein
MVLILLLIWLGGAGWWFRGTVQSWLAGLGAVVAPGRKQPDPKTYAVLVSELARWRAELGKRHARAGSDAERALVENDARLVLELVLPEMMRCWMGTPWDFNGTASKPGGGKIACGYFVATVLMDAGFQVDRYQLAQQASGNILRSFLEKEECSLIVGKPYEEYASLISKSERGIYLVGLDTHVAFLVREADAFKFIHSSGSRPWCVVEESRDEAQVLQRSRWRMTGNLTADATVLRRWLKAEKIVVHGT